MPVCPGCGARSDDGKVFCPECGQKFIKPPDGDDQTSVPADQDLPEWQKKYQQYQNKYPQYRYNTRKTVNTAEKNAEPSANSGKTPGTVSLVFGILSFAFCFFPVFSAVGLITGIAGVKKSGRAAAKAGLILSATSLALFTVALIITIINGFDFGAFAERLKAGNIFS